MSNTKYDNLISSYNSEEYAELEKYFEDSFHTYDILSFTKYMLDLGYDLFDFYDIMKYAHKLDIHGYMFEPTKFSKNA